MMTEFKVGDRVRYIPCIGSDEWQSVTLHTPPSDGDSIWIGDDPVSGRGGFTPDEIELLVSMEDELADLRAFRDTALASGYVPPAAVDPDVAEAAEIAKADGWGFCDDNPIDGSAMYSILKGIKRGRELATQEVGK